MLSFFFKLLERALLVVLAGACKTVPASERTRCRHGFRPGVLSEALRTRARLPLPLLLLRGNRGVLPCAGCVGRALEEGWQ